MPPVDDPDLNPTSDGLGEVLFQRRGAFFHALLACLVYWPVCFIIPVGLALLVRKQGVGNLRDLGVYAFGVMMCLGLGFMGYVGLAQYRPFRVYEGGVSRRAWGRTRFLLFREIMGFWAGGHHAYARGAYLGPSYSFAFYSAPGSDKRPMFVELASFRFTARQQYVDQELENFRDRMYHMMFERMLQQIQLDRPVNWVRSLRLLPEGLEYQPNTRSGEDKQVFPYASISRAEIDRHAGRLKIVLGTEPEPRISARIVRQPNDISGLMLLNWLRQK